MIVIFTRLNKDRYRLCLTVDIANRYLFIDSTVFKTDKSVKPLNQNHNSNAAESATDLKYITIAKETDFLQLFHINRSAS